MHGRKVGVMARPQDKNLIPLTERSEEEAFHIRSMGGKAMQAKRKAMTEQKYLLGKYAGLPIVDKRTIRKFEKMGFENEEINRALEITHAIMKGAREGDPRMVEIYLRMTGEDKPEPAQRENNLLDMLLEKTGKDIDTDDLPELQQKTAPGADLVEPAKLEG